MRASFSLACAALLVACGTSTPRPTTTGSPSAASSGASAATTPSAPIESEADQPTLDEAPKLGFLERRSDGTCWYGTNPAGPLQRVIACPPTMADASAKQLPTEDAPVGGYLEKIVENGTCWWSLHAPSECPTGICKPDPPVDRVRCP